MVVDATARLYDVDEDRVVFTKLDQTKSYDHGTIKFRARKGTLIDLDKLHESIWATRLSRSTRSGLVSLEVTAIGKVVSTKDGLVLKVSGSRAEFALGKHSDRKHAGSYQELTAGATDRVVRVTGLIDNYRGHWPNLLRNPPAQPRRILVTGVDP